jgi:hypothetical protein
LSDEPNKALIEEIRELTNNHLPFKEEEKRYSPYFIGKWLKANGYLRVRKVIDKKVIYFYIRVEDKKGYIFKNKQISNISKS